MAKAIEILSEVMAVTEDKLKEYINGHARRIVRFFSLKDTQ